MFPVTLGWTSVGGLTDNRQWEDMGKRHRELSAWWPSVGGKQAGSDKGQTANCFLQFPLNANQEEQKTVLAGFSYFLCWASASSSPIHLLSCPLILFFSRLSAFFFHLRLSTDSCGNSWGKAQNMFLRMCVLSDPLTLTIWSSFICIVYCSPGTWSLVSFSHNILSHSLAL